jgi:uracil-DNA glycosylase
MFKFNNEWDILIRDEFSKPYYISLRQFLMKEYTYSKVYPDMNDIFNSLTLTSFSDVKVIIIGQDPYHGEGQAHGLAFSVKKGVDIPPSLMNIFKELHNDVGFEIPNHGFLEEWAKQGVLLLNTVLTVRKDEPNSHKGCGWEQFTDQVIKTLNKKEKPVVFILWGNNAKQKEKLITNNVHLVLTAPHPSPLSAYNGFWDCKHFSKTNDFLKMTGQSPIDWQIS